MTVFFKQAICFCLAVTAFLLVAEEEAFAQTSPLQQPPPSNSSQNQGPNNIIERLFASPGAANAMQQANPSANSPYADLGGVPKFPTNFWAGLFNKNIIPSDTVLTGTLEDDLSSKSSKVGDIFSILLADGYTLNNEILIPANAKIVGSVVSVIPAGTQGNGTPGSMQVSLQTLILPDSRSVPINALIQCNPNQPDKIDIKKGRGIPVGEYAQSFEYAVSAAAGSLTRQVGVPFPVKTQTGGGPDFALKKGQVLPIKLSQPLDVTTFSTSQPLPPQNGSPPNVVPGQQPSNNNQNSMPVLTSPAGGQGTPAFNPYPTYPTNAPSNQSLPNFPDNTLPGNSSPAGPEPF